MKFILLALNLITRGNTRKQIAIVLTTITVSVMLPFAAVFSMGSSVLEYLLNVPSLEAAESEGFYTGGMVEGNTYEWGNCTYWSYAMRRWSGHPIPLTWGNANTWDDRARQDGYIVNRTPAVGAISQSDEGKWGHVAYVSAVDRTTGQWTISEMNYKGLNIVSQRSFMKESAERYNFIHGKIGEAWSPHPISLL